MDIKIYRISTCHWCDKVESFLKRFNVPYRSVVVDLLTGSEQENAVAEAYHLSKQRSFPVTCIDGACVIGFHESKLRHLLRLPLQEDKPKQITLTGVEADACSFPGDKDHHETIEKMREWLEREAKNHGYKINPDQKMVDDILWGLAVNDKRYGYKACPCRLATGKYQLDCDIICPCSYCFLDVEKNGRCYCTLFVSDRFISGDPSLPPYIPDSRERSQTAVRAIGNVKQETTEITTKEPEFISKRYIKVVGFLYGAREQNKAKDDFLAIVRGLEQDPSAILWRENTAHVSAVINGAKITAMLREDADLYTYQIAYTAVDDKAMQGKDLFQRPDFAEHKDRLFECHIVVPDGGHVKGDFQFILTGQKYASYAYNKSEVIAGFEDEGIGKDVFIITAEGYAFERIVEDIVSLEISYHLLSTERHRYVLAEDKLNQLDSTIVAKMGFISMNLPRSRPEALKEWLHGLSNNYGEISGIAESSRHRMNDTLQKRDTIQKIFKDWGENSGELGYPLLSRFFIEKADNLCTQYQRLFTRIDGIRREMVDLITILRTKIDLTLQEQNLELQRSMDKTAKTQMIMQHTVEGLSVIILSYYTVHLAEFIFESLEASHIINISLSTAKGIFVPVAIVLSWFLTFRARRLIKKHSSDNSK